MNKIDYKNGEYVTIACIIGNIILSLFKLYAGILGGSKAMIADAMHSVSDIIATTVVLIGIKIAKRPVDKEHPYGHGKVEPIVAAFVGITLVLASILIVKGIIEAIIEHSFTTPSFLALFAAIVSIVVKEAMYRITYAAGKKINSEAIMADAWHHRSDAYSSIGSFFGILGSMIGNHFNIGFLKYLDPIAGTVVACLILKVAFRILKNSIKNLMDTSPGHETINKIKDIAMNVDGVLSIPDVKGRYVGQHLFIDLEIEVHSGITVEAGHALAVRVREMVIETIKDVYDVLVHVEPGTDN